MKSVLSSFSLAAAAWLAACGAEQPEPSAAADETTSMGSPASGGSQNAALAAQAVGPTVTIATYNVNFGMAGDPPTLQAIEGLGADIVFLQETNAAWERALAPARSAYPHMAFRHCCNAGGLAILSKTPFSQKEYVHPEGAWFPAWRIVVDTDLGPVQVVNVHLRPNISDGGSVVSGLFTTPAIRESEIEHYIATVDDGLPAVFVGDFNEPADGLAIQRLNARGMRSALPEAGGRQHTWHWQTSLGRIRKQFDHVVYGEQLELVSAHVAYEGRSDHFPVVATLRRRSKTGTNMTYRK